MSLYTIEYNSKDDTLTGRRGDICETATIDNCSIDEAAEALRSKMMRALSAASYLRLVTGSADLVDELDEKSIRALEALHRDQ